MLVVVASIGLEEKKMIDDFDNTASHMIMHHPVAKRKSASSNANGDNMDHVPEEEAIASSCVSGKSSKGKTIEEARCYRQVDFNK